jgi:hypothetical protein
MFGAWTIILVSYLGSLLSAFAVGTTKPFLLTFNNVILLIVLTKINAVSAIVNSSFKKISYLPLLTEEINEKSFNFHSSCVLIF